MDTAEWRGGICGEVAPICAGISWQCIITDNTFVWAGPGMGGKPSTGRAGRGDSVIMSYLIFCCNPRNPLLGSAWTFLQLNTWSEISAWQCRVCAGQAAWQCHEPMILVENGPLSQPGPAHLDLSLRLGAGARNGLGKIMSLKVRVVLVTVMFRLESCSPRSCSWSLAGGSWPAQVRSNNCLWMDWSQHCGTQVAWHGWHAHCTGAGQWVSGHPFIILHPSVSEELETAVRTVSLKTAQC